MSTIAEITELMTSKLGADLFEKTGRFIEGIAPLFSAGLGLYIVLLTFYYYNRGLDEAILDLFKRIMVWLLIIACAFNAGNYTHLATVIYALPDQFSALFGDGGGNPLNAVDKGLQSIDKMVASLDKISKGKQWYEIQVHMAVYGAKLSVTILGYLLFVIAYAFYLIGKVCLALTLMVGPLFLGSALFPGTRQYFMNWMGQCFNYIVTIGLFTIIGVIQSEFVQSSVHDWVKDSATWDIVQAWKVVGQLLLMTIVFIISALSIPSIAAALTGGAMADTHGRTLGRVGGNAMRGFRGIQQGLQNMTVGRSNRAGKG